MTTRLSARSRKPAATKAQPRGLGKGAGLDVGSGTILPKSYTGRSDAFQSQACGDKKLKIVYFRCSSLAASFSATVSASVALTFTSGETPVPSQLVLEIGLMGVVSGTLMVK